jgi:hypothetical protein
MALTSPKEGERGVCLRLLARVNRTGPVTVFGDKGYAGADFEADAAALGARIVRPRRKDEPDGGLHSAPLRRRIESIYWTAKDILALERHGARTLRGLRARIAGRFLALAAAVSLNHQLGRNSRALVDYDAKQNANRRFQRRARGRESEVRKGLCQETRVVATRTDPGVRRGDGSSAKDPATDLPGQRIFASQLGKTV